MNKRVKLEETLPILQEQLDAGGRVSFRIHGISMMPMLRDRQDSVTLCKPQSPPKKLDIILYRRADGSFVLHRIVGIKDGGYVCRGDNQTSDEYPVKDEDIIAVVSEYTRNGKRKSISCISHRIYTFLWVNTVFIRKLFARIKHNRKEEK